jgi:1-acyl-sn-glycerol-3-phosphate acyltransferase
MTAFLRSLLFAPLAILVTAPAGLLVALSICLPLRARFAIIAAWRGVFMALCHYVLGLDYRVIGRENIPNRPSVVLSKHQSAWETVGLQCIFPQVVFVLKKSLLLIPFLGWGLAAARMISIDRSAGKDALRQVVDQGRARLGDGCTVVVFPEGTRIAPGASRRFKTGGAQLAVSTGALVVPVAHDAGEFWARNAFVKKPGLITVSIGPAIDPAGKSASEVTTLAEQWIESEMHRLSPHRYTPTPAHALAG